MDHLFFYSMCLISSILILSLDVVILLSKRSSSSVAFSISILLTAIWSFLLGIMYSLTDSSSVTLIIRVLHLLGLYITISFIVFAIYYPDNKKINRKTFLLLSIPTVIVTYFCILTGTVIDSVSYVGGSVLWTWNFGMLGKLYALLFIASWVYILYRIYKLKNVSSLTDSKKQNVELMFKSLLLGIIPPVISDIVLPQFGIYVLSPFGSVATFIWVVVISYSILKHQQMNIKVVVTEVLAVAMSAIFFINIFIDVPFGVYGRICTFLGFIALAYFMIRGVLTEAKQKEQLALLNSTLETKVREQTAVIRKSYEDEKRAKHELEKLNDAKNQFIMITQHNIRTPLLNINRNIDELKNLNKRPIKAAKLTFEKIRIATEKLNHFTDEFLNIVTVKMGADILKIEHESLWPTMSSLLKDFQDDINEKDLELDWPQSITDWPPIDVDANKIRECLYIILENAIKYNNRGGKIEIRTWHKDGVFHISIYNTGIGIESYELKDIGNSLFFRGKEAKVSNPIGMGIGLSVVRSMMKAHAGTLDIESKGKDTGAKITISLPTSRGIQTTS